MLELWQNYCIGKTNERYRFNNRLQESDESIDAFTTALRTLTETCEFGSLKEDLIRDRLVCGIRDNSLRKKLLQGVQRLIGMVKYLSKFVTNLSEVCQPLRKLTHKDAEWQWTQEQKRAFQSLKVAVTQAPVLKYFSLEAQTEGQDDASQKGLGFVLMQEGQPVTYASRALTPAEQRYSQIEKELLAQVFGLEYYPHYTFGRRVILWTDHKPLISIYKKPLASAPKCLQRLLLRLQQYDV